MGEVSSGLLHLHQQISAPDPYKLKLWSFFVQTVIISFLDKFQIKVTPKALKYA